MLTTTQAEYVGGAKGMLPGDFPHIDQNTDILSIRQMVVLFKCVTFLFGGLGYDTPKICNGCIDMILTEKNKITFSSTSK